MALTWQATHMMIVLEQSLRGVCDDEQREQFEAADQWN